MISLLAALLVFAAPLPSQTIGGKCDMLHQWDGQKPSESFSYSLSNAGDLNADGFDDVIIGSHFAHPIGLEEVGSAFAYSGVDGTLLYRWNGEAAEDRFGWSVAGAGDINADGFDDVIIGAKFADIGGLVNKGSAYIYSGFDGSLIHKLEGATEHDRFGWGVSGAGDINGDGYDDVVIGAKFANPNGLSSAGTAYAYSGLDGAKIYQWDGNAAGDLVGWWVSDAGDLNGDGFADVIVGAKGADPGGLTDAGSAFAFSGADGSTLYRWDGSAPNDFFGWNVAGAGDIDGDGFDDVLISANLADPNNNSNAGSAYAFSGADGNLLFKWDGESSNDHLGWALSGAGDFNGDGFNDVIIGAKYANPNGLISAGSTFCFSGADGSLLAQWDGAAKGDLLGFSVSGGGDINGDGRADVIIGATEADPGGLTSAGSVFAYGFNPFIHANASSVSASTGGTLSLDLDFPESAASDEYKILISESGVGPTHFGIEIPLTRDSLVVDTFYGNYPVPTYNDLHGMLDIHGNATGSLTVPAGIPSTLIGNTFYFVAVAHQSGQLPEYSSVAISISIIP